MGAKCCKSEDKKNTYDNYQRRKSSILNVPMPVMPHSSYIEHHRDEQQQQKQCSADHSHTGTSQTHNSDTQCHHH